MARLCWPIGFFASCWKPCGIFSSRSQWAGMFLLELNRSITTPKMMKPYFDINLCRWRHQCKRRQMEFQVILIFHPSWFACYTTLLYMYGIFLYPHIGWDLRFHELSFHFHIFFLKLMIEYGCFHLGSLYFLSFVLFICLILYELSRKILFYYGKLTSSGVSLFQTCFSCYIFVRLTLKPMRSMLRWLFNL